MKNFKVFFYFSLRYFIFFSICVYLVVNAYMSEFVFTQKMVDKIVYFFFLVSSLLLSLLSEFPYPNSSLKSWAVLSMSCATLLMPSPDFGLFYNFPCWVVVKVICSNTDEWAFILSNIYTWLPSMFSQTRAYLVENQSGASGFYCSLCLLNILGDTDNFVKNFGENSLYFIFWNFGYPNLNLDDGSNDWNVLLLIVLVYRSFLSTQSGNEWGGLKFFIKLIYMSFLSFSPFLGFLPEPSFCYQKSPKRIPSVKQSFFTEGSRELEIQLKRGSVRSLSWTSYDPVTENSIFKIERFEEKYKYQSKTDGGEKILSEDLCRKMAYSYDNDAPFVDSCIDFSILTLSHCKKYDDLGESEFCLLSLKADRNYCGSWKVNGIKKGVSSRFAALSMVHNVMFFGELNIHFLKACLECRCPKTLREIMGNSPFKRYTSELKLLGKMIEGGPKIKYPTEKLKPAWSTRIEKLVNEDVVINFVRNGEGSEKVKSVENEEGKVFHERPFFEKIVHLGSKKSDDNVKLEEEKEAGVREEKDRSKDMNIVSLESFSRSARSSVKMSLSLDPYDKNYEEAVVKTIEIINSDRLIDWIKNKFFQKRAVNGLKRMPSIKSGVEELEKSIERMEYPKMTVKKRMQVESFKKELSSKKGNLKRIEEDPFFEAAKRADGGNFSLPKIIEELTSEIKNEYIVVTSSGETYNPPENLKTAKEPVKECRKLSMESASELYFKNWENLRRKNKRSKWNSDYLLRVGRRTGQLINSINNVKKVKEVKEVNIEVGEENEENKKEEIYLSEKLSKKSLYVVDRRGKKSPLYKLFNVKNIQWKTLKKMAFFENKERERVEKGKNKVEENYDKKLEENKETFIEIISIFIGNVFKSVNF